MHATLGPSDTPLTASPGVHTEVDFNLLEDWRHAARDPDVHVPRWLAHGAPAGVSLMPELAGVFPEVDAGPKHDIEPATWSEDLQKYKSVEDDPNAAGEVNKLLSTSFFDEFDSYKALVNAVNGEPVMSKLALITKIQGEKLKLRLILDCLQSGVNAMTKQLERILLPMVMDIINDTLDLTTVLVKEEVIEYLVLDYTDAFFRVPLHPQERRFVTAFFGGRFM